MRTIQKKNTFFFYCRADVLYLKVQLSENNTKEKWFFLSLSNERTVSKNVILFGFDTMLIDEIIFQITCELAHQPTDGQGDVLRTFAHFLADRDERTVMILRGSAGTGKTTLAGAIVRFLKRLEQDVVLLAPTGRAAKVFSMNSGSPAHTIHRWIYRQRTIDGGGGSFDLGFNKLRDALFVVDEASMIARGLELGGGSFGSGSLLDDLISFVYGTGSCRMLLIGDKAQLPPVGEQESPALSDDVLAGYGLKVYSCDLDEVLRQSAESGILWNATRIRGGNAGVLPRIETALPDVSVVPGDELIESLATSYSKAGMDETIVVTRSNKRANIYNMGIRNTILDREEELTKGDRLMVVKNNYFWTEKEKNDNRNGNDNGNLPQPPVPAFIANGDIAVVERVRNVRELFGFRFADVRLCFPDYDDYELQTTVLLDTLYSESPSLTRDQQEKLFNAVLEDYAHIPNKKERMKQLRQDVYYNALQIKFAYAVTCHKAQGGQWAHVYIDQGYLTDDMANNDYIHWLYTAFTRATEQIYLVNWPKSQLVHYEDNN